MPPAQRDGAPDDDGLTEYRPSKGHSRQLPRALAGIFPSIQTSTAFLEQEIQVPSRLIPGFERNDTPEEYWRTVLVAADRNELGDAFYHRLFVAVRRRKLFNERLDLIFGDHPWTDLPTGQVVAVPRQEGCHVIVWTRHEPVQDVVRRWLE